MVTRWLFVACYAASGAAALVYQVVWVRLLTLELGHTVASSSIVLGAFMCGLALGAWIAGRTRLPPSRSLALYAMLEILIGAAAISLPAVLSLFEPLLSWAYADGMASTRFAIVRAAICFALLGVPAAAMGATFPIAVGWFVNLATRERSHGAAHAVTEAGILYAANTAGAAIGTLATGFWLLPTLGARGSTWIAVGLNVFAACGALWLRHVGTESPGPSSMRPSARVKRHSKHAVQTRAPQPAIASLAAALSGFSALAFEVAWTRLIATIIGPTTYAFAIMAASFIVGIALGSMLGVRIARAGSQRVVWLAAMLITAATGTLVAAWFTALEVPLIVARYVNESGAFAPLLLREALVVGLVVTAASITFGTTFTLALATASPADDSAARDTSIVYTSNTIGAVLGSLAAGFFLLPRFGLASTFVHTSRILIAAGALLAVITFYRRDRRGLSAPITALAGAFLFACTFALPAWNQALLASGLYKYSRQMAPEDLEINLRAGRLAYYKEGAAGTVSVKEVGGTRSLAIDGKVDASNGGDMLTQRLLGLLPTLVHPDAHDALVIGLGSGVTADAVMATGTVRRVDIVEISAEVVDAAALFEEENGGVLGTAGVRLLIGDGRTHLQLTPRQYDVIVSEPSNPWMAGVAALFTREFFEAVRRRLTPDGVFCQWAHTYEIDAADLRSIVRTFAAVFPHGTLWLVGDGDLLLIGAMKPEIDRLLAGVPERVQRGSVLPMLAQTGVPAQSAPFFLFSLYAGGAAEMTSYAASAGIQSDDRMDLEFTAARAMYAPPNGNARALRAIADGAAQPVAIAAQMRAARAGDWAARGDAALKAEAFEMASDSFRRAAALDTASFDAYRGGVTAAAAAGKLAEQSERLRKKAVEEPDNAAVRTAVSYSLALAGDMEGAVAAAIEATRLDPDSPQPLEQLASVFADLGDPRLGPVAETLITRFPDRGEGRYYRGAALFLQSHREEARAEIDRLLEINPRHAKASNLRGIMCATQGDHTCAIAAFEASLKGDPRDATVYVNLGNAHLERGDVERAVGYFSEALVIDPTAETAREALRELGAAR